MASSPVTSWQLGGETVKTVADFILGGLQNHCRWWLQPWIKRCLLLGRNVMTNLDSILKSRDITLPAKVHLVKAEVFPVVMYGYESWTIKKAERWRIDVLEKTLESPLDCKEIQPVHPKGDQSWVFIGRTEAAAETPILWPPYANNLLDKTLMLGKIEGSRRRAWQRMRRLDGITNLMDMS